MNVLQCVGTGTVANTKNTNTKEIFVYLPLNNPTAEGGVQLDVKQVQNTGRNSAAGTFYVGGEQWDTGLAWEGGGGDINTYISATQTFPNQANANIAQAGTVTASLSNVVGRGTVSITQMPSAANDFTVIVHIREKASGAANYTFNINTNAY